MELSETKRDLAFYLRELGIEIRTITAILNLLPGDEEAEELIQFLPQIPSEIYLKNSIAAEEVIFLKAVELSGHILKTEK